MEIETIVHENVKRDGTFEDKPGSVEVNGCVRMSDTNGGCGLRNCHCSDGHWLTIVKPRDSWGRVEVVKVIFNDGDEMQRFLTDRQTY